MNNEFNPIEYFKLLAEQNRMCREQGFRVAMCSGPDNIEGIMDEFRDTQNFIVIDDTTDNSVHNSRPSWFTRSMYTVWILAATPFGDTGQTKERMNMCRNIFRQFLSRMIADKSRRAYGMGMEFLQLDNVLYKELGRYSFNGTTGLYFMVENDVPTNLTYHADEWQ